MVDDECSNCQHMRWLVANLVGQLKASQEKADTEKKEWDRIVHSGSGSNANQCAPIQATGQSGNAQGVTDLIEANSDTDEFEFEENGSTITTSPSGSTECVQEVNQAASAAAAPKAAPAPAPAPKAAPAPAPAPMAAPAPAPKPAPAPPPARKAEAKKAEAKKAEKKKQLPKTGGSDAASLFALGTGALLVGGGLMARRFLR